jgi:ferric iron reductase protein FhuF
MNPPLFAGELARFGESLVALDDPREVHALPALLQPAVLDALLLRIYGPELMPSQRPVLVSQWSKYYFMQLIPPLLTASLLHDWRWPLGLERVSLAVDERGLPDGIKLEGLGEPWAHAPLERFQRFAELLDTHLQPFIQALSAYGGVASGVLWGNAGDYLETCLRQLSQVTDRPLDAGHALLTQPTRPDGRRNPLFNAVSYPGQPPRRQRRSCCLSYQVQWVGRCEHCPLG